jgi:hypothetical protein
VLMMLMLRGRQLYDKWKGGKEAKPLPQKAESGK